MYSPYDDGCGNGTPESVIRPTAIVKGRARAAHRAARLWKGLEWSSQAVTNYKQWLDTEAVKVKDSKPGPQTATAAPSGDMVRMRETVDVTKVREVPMMEPKDWGIGLDLFFKLMMRAPFPAGNRH